MDSEIRNMLHLSFGLKDVAISKLVGYSNENYKITDRQGKNFVLKVFPAKDVDSPFVEDQSYILDKLARRFPDQFQSPVKSTQGNFLVSSSDTTRRFQLLSWLHGNFLAQVEHTPKIFTSFGEILGKMDLELMSKNSSAIKARRIDWDIQYFLDLSSSAKSIADTTLRKVVDYSLLQFKEHVLPELPQLRKSIIHNDANDWNVLVRNGKDAGMIDFGDMVYAPLIQELAVALSYALMAKHDPLKWAGYIIKAYHKICPLHEREIDLIYYLVAARLSMSLIHSYVVLQEGRADEYTLISQKPAMMLLKKWIQISPDKASNEFRLALGFSIPEKTNYSQELRRRYQSIGHVLSTSYTHPVKMKRAIFQFMFDADGNTFLDAYNNIPHVGHQHPKVVEAGQKQMALLNTNTRYIYDQLARYAEQLLAKFPDPLNKVFFVNSGSAASDLAIRMAQNFTGHPNIVVMEHGYHGHTRLGVDISHYKFNHKGGAGQQEFILKADIPDTYRGKYKKQDAGEKYALDLKDELNRWGKKVAAFISEPIVGCGGQVPLAPGYLKAVYPMIRKQGGLCISDEVQTGFGRLGTHFWGFETQGVIPDMVVLGKPMGNGHPMGAVVTTDGIAEAFDNGMEFFSSFGGNPVSCEIGRTVLDVIAQEGLQQNALDTGNYLMHQLRDLQQDFAQIGDVRGSGLFVGVEFVKNPETMDANTELAQYLKNKLRENYILVSTDGPFDSVMKMKPPLCFDKSNADQLVENMKSLLTSYEG